jgi:hypothetical protein
MRTALAIALIASLTPAWGGCAGKPKTASVGGDVYLLMQNGDVKRGAANTVRLLADSGSLRQGMDRLCRWYAGRRDTLAALGRLSRAWFDSEAILDAAMRGRMTATLVGARVTESATGVNAHFQFTGLTPGRYVLWAETEIGEHHYTWWAPLVLAAGDSAKKDLDNSTEADHFVYCGQYADSVAAAESVATAARLKPLRDCYREARRVTTGYLEDRIAACNRKFGYTGGTERH